MTQYFALEGKFYQGKVEDGNVHAHEVTQEELNDELKAAMEKVNELQNAIATLQFSNLDASKITANPPATAAETAAPIVPDPVPAEATPFTAPAAPTSGQ
jgi:hypothetical protein